MLRTHVAAGLAAMTLVAGPALAQTAPASAGNAPAANTTSQGQGSAPTDARSGQFMTQMPNNLMRGSKLIGVDVIGLDHTRIGDIQEVLLDQRGQIQAVVIGVGGFLGIGEKNVAVPFNMLLWNTGDVARTASPSASPMPGNTPANQEAAAARAERMPGANVSNEVLNAVPENRSGTVTPGTGEVTGSAAGGTATVPVVDAEGGPRRAMLRLTKAELQNAPEFRYGREGADTKPPASAPRQ